MAIPVCHLALRDVHGLSWQEPLVTVGRCFINRGRHPLMASERGGEAFPDLSSSGHVLFSPLTVHVAFGEPFSLAKLARLVAIPSTSRILPISNKIL